MIVLIQNKFIMIVLTQNYQHCQHLFLSLQTYIHLQVMYWVLEGITGFLTGVVAFLINICVSYLFQLKFGQFDKGMTYYFCYLSEFYPLIS